MMKALAEVDHKVLVVNVLQAHLLGVVLANHLLLHLADDLLGVAHELALIRFSTGGDHATALLAGAR